MDYDEELLGMLGVFKDRRDAGMRLAKFMKGKGVDVDIVYAIPCGGIPVGLAIAREYKCEFDVLVCRKLLIPWNREAGFGAVAPDGEVYVNERLATYLGLTHKEILREVKYELSVISERLKALRGGAVYPDDLSGNSVAIVDDGIAAGYTMGSAVKFIRRRKPKEAIIDVPTGHLESCIKLRREVERLIVLNLRAGPIFAVADAYAEWRDLEIDEVKEMITKFRQRFQRA